MPSPRLPRIMLTGLLLLLLTPGGCGRSDGQTDAGLDRAAAAAGAPLAETATDNIFVPDSYSIAAAKGYTLTMANNGDAIHNWHILDVKRGGGKEIDTQLTAAHKTSRVTFAIEKAGVYHFQCDVHPDTMKGTITVR